MATKKSDTEKKVTPAAVEEKEEAAVKVETEVEAVEADVTVEEKEEERVMVMIPYIPGQDPEETVTINGYITKIKRGEQVWVTRPVASVLENSYEAQRIAMINREKLKNQRTDL